MGILLCALIEFSPAQSLQVSFPFFQSHLFGSMSNVVVREKRLAEYEREIFEIRTKCLRCRFILDIVPNVHYTMRK